MAINNSTTLQQVKTFPGACKTYTSAHIESMLISAEREIVYIQLKKPFYIGFSEIGSDTINVIKAAEVIKSKAFPGCFSPEDGPVIQFWGNRAKTVESCDHQTKNQKPKTLKH